MNKNTKKSTKADKSDEIPEKGSALPVSKSAAEVQDMIERIDAETSKIHAENARIRQEFSEQISDDFLAERIPKQKGSDVLSKDAENQAAIADEFDHAHLGIFNEEAVEMESKQAETDTGSAR